MKTSWMLSFLIPSFVLTAYPIYDDDATSDQPELVTRGSRSSQNAHQEKQSRKATGSHSEGETLKKSKQREKDQPHFSDKKTVNSEKSAPSPAEDKQSAISKRESIQRNSTLQNYSSRRSKLRRNPNRPRVIQRNEQKQLQDLSKIEADAEEGEKELPRQSKRENQDKSFPESVTDQEIDEN